MGFLDRLRPRKPGQADLATVREYFTQAAADEEHYPSTIDPRILFVRAVLDHLGDLNGRIAADIGSGKGRFARLVKERSPRATVIALDIAETMLHHVPADVSKVAASMTQLPLATTSVDGAYAIESLEHAVDIEGAVAELARIVKPGGRIAIIDKNARKWGHAGDTSLGTLVRASRTRTAAKAALCSRGKPPYFVLGRREAGRLVPGMVCREVGHAPNWLRHPFRRSGFRAVGQSPGQGHP